ncbi:hypothetical protein [Burkholderia cenocepacia]|uniref:hypothetical protein n=1 Tax=Burkholderia cenocepacia TaxID=95486 RepID=UPI0007621BA4|nr:hypothetical protein [Burkholderia cenocepacia]KWU26416.1 hypothetical protein AS149_25855 [Burkholderia cenocepacia]
MSSEDATITLAPDNLAVALRKIREIQQSLGTIANIIKDGSPLNADLGANVLKVTEFYLGDLGKALGIETDDEAARKLRNANLRAANLKIHELEAQLGDSASPELTQLNLRALAKRLEAWWELEGFGHVSNIAFEPHGCKVTFSCHLFGGFPLVDSKTPVSDKEREHLWHASLQERGFVLTEEGREVSLLDCDASRQALCDLLRSRLPSARVFRMENMHKQNAGDFILRSVEVYIQKISDLLQLPVPQAPQK